MRETEAVYLLDRGDRVPIDDALCMDRGTYLRLLDLSLEDIRSEIE